MCRACWTRSTSCSLCQLMCRVLPLQERANKHIQSRIPGAAEVQLLTLDECLAVRLCMPPQSLSLTSFLSLSPQSSYLWTCCPRRHRPCVRPDELVAEAGLGIAQDALLSSPHPAWRLVSGASRHARTPSSARRGSRQGHIVWSDYRASRLCDSQTLRNKYRRRKQPDAVHPPSSPCSGPTRPSHPMQPTLFSAAPLRPSPAPVTASAAPKPPLCLPRYSQHLFIQDCAYKTGASYTGSACARDRSPARFGFLTILVLYAAPMPHHHGENRPLMR